MTLCTDSSRFDSTGLYASEIARWGFDVEGEAGQVQAFEARVFAGHVADRTVRYVEHAELEQAKNFRSLEAEFIDGRKIGGDRATGHLHQVLGPERAIDVAEELAGSIAARDLQVRTGQIRGLSCGLSHRKCDPGAEKRRAEEFHIHPRFLLLIFLHLLLPGTDI